MALCLLLIMPGTKSIKNLKKTKNLLDNSIAIPIWLKKKVLDYRLIGAEIKKSLRKKNKK